MKKVIIPVLATLFFVGCDEQPQRSLIKRTVSQKREPSTAV